MDKFYYSKEEQKTPSVYVGEFFEFHFLYDLSENVKIKKLPYININEFTINEYNQDFSKFLFNHIHNIWPHLNGFSGYDTVRYQIDEKIIIC